MSEQEITKEELQEISDALNQNAEKFQEEVQEEIEETTQDETATEHSVEETKEENTEQITEEENIEETPEKSYRKWYYGIGAVLGTLLLIYVGVSFYFMEHFNYHTVLSGEDVSLMSVEEVEELFQQKIAEYHLLLEKRGDKTETIYGKDISLAYLDNGCVDKVMNQQSAWGWISSLWNKSELDAEWDIEYQEEELQQLIQNLECLQKESQEKPVNAKPVYKDGIYIIQKEELGTTIEKENLEKAIQEAIGDLQSVLILEDANCYVNPTFYEYSKEVLAAADTMNQYIKAKITYEFGKKTEEVGATQIAKFLSVDNKMQVQVSQKSVKSYVKKLAEKYDTVGHEKQLETPTGKKAKVSGGNYGWKIDQEEETAKLIEDIKAGNQVTRDPAYSKTAISRGETEWGSTYIEVDISEQHMWYIEKGEVKLETDVVTGSPGRDTPQGIYTILEKMRNKTLRGNILPNGKREYETPVAYWARVTWSGIGFHDATWQPAFGGKLYKQGRGSHGCINMPYQAVADLYSMISVGCPVIIHY